MKTIPALLVLLATLAHADPSREYYDLKKQVAAGADDPNIRVRLAQLAIATGNYQEADEALKWIRTNNVPSWSEWATTQAKYLPLLGKKAPEFQGKDLDGWTIKRSDFENRIAVVHFWSAADSASQGSLAQMADIYRKWKPNPYFSMFGVTMDKDKAGVQSVVAAQKVGWPQMFEAQGSDSPTAKAFQVHGIPMAAVLDQDGTVRYIGPLGQMLNDVVDSVMQQIDEKQQAAKSASAMSPRSKDGKIVFAQTAEVFSPQAPSKVQGKVKAGSVVTVTKVDPATGMATILYDDSVTGKTTEGLVKLGEDGRK